MVLTAVLLAATPILLLTLIFFYIRRCNNSTPPEEPAPAKQKAPEAVQESSADKAVTKLPKKSSKSSASGEKKQSKTKLKIKRVDVEREKKPDETPQPKAINEPFSTPFAGVKAEEVTDDALNNEVSNEKTISEVAGPTSNDSQSQKQLPIVNCIESHPKAVEESPVAEDTKVFIKKEDSRNDETSALHKAIDELEFQAKIMLESAKLSSGNATHDQQEKNHLKDQVKKLEGKLLSQKASLTSQIQHLENQLVAAHSENTQLANSNEQELIKLKTITQTQLSKLNQQDDHLRKFEYSLESINKDLQDRTKEKEMLSAELIAQKDNYNSLLRKYQEMLQYVNYQHQTMPPSGPAQNQATVYDILKSLDTQLSIQIEHEPAELEDPLVMSTRIFKAIKRHIKENSSSLSEPASSPVTANHSSSIVNNDRVTKETIATINKCLAEQFTAHGNISLPTLTSLHNAEHLKSWLAGVSAAFSAKQKSELPAVPAKPADHSPLKQSSESTTASDHADSRVHANDFYFALVEKLGSQTVPVLSTNINEWVDELLQAIYANAPHNAPMSAQSSSVSHEKQRPMLDTQ